jgi:hypothetical protein
MKQKIKILTGTLLAATSLLSCKDDPKIDDSRNDLTSEVTSAPQNDYRNTPLFKNLVYTGYLDEYSDIVIADYDSTDKKLQLVSVIQGKSWFTEDDSSNVPYDFRWEVTDRPNRLVFFRNRSNPSPTPRDFMNEVTEEEVKRLETLGEEPYSSPEERIEAFLSRWSDIALVRCDQNSGSVQDFYAYKGNHFKSNDDINRHKELIIGNKFKESYECILYGNFNSDTPEVHVAWIAYSWLIFPGRQSVLNSDFRKAAYNLSKK